MSERINLDSGKVWLVTGCSSGFGRHLVHAVIARGDKVIATARKTSDLDYIRYIPGSESKALAITLDVTDPFDRVSEEINKAISHLGSIDFLVNNAGFVQSGVWEEVSDEENKMQFDTNVFGAMKVTRAVLPYFRKARSGVVLFMGSIAGWHGAAAGGPYTASKAAIEGAAECLANETAHLGIRVHVLVIGLFRTGILDGHKKKGNLAPTGISDYDAAKAALADRQRETHGRQPGDPALAAERVLDIARLENLTEGQKKEMPLRIPLGSDAVGIMRNKCKKTLDFLKGWEGFAASTEFADMSGTSRPSYV